MAPRRCVFCDRTPVTKEHVWPRWISGLLKEYGPFTVNTPEDAVRAARELDHQVRWVCGSCNGGWMSDLETTTRPLLETMILANPETRLLAPADQVRLARWAMKTFLVASLLNGDRVGIEEAAFRRACDRQGLPHPSRTFIWLSAYDQDTHAVQCRLSAMARHGSDDPPYLGAYGRIALFRVLFEIAHFNEAAPISLPGAIWWDDVATRLWPATGETRMWPERRLAFPSGSVDAWRVTDPLPAETLDRFRRQ